MEQTAQYIPLVASPLPGEAPILNEETYNTLKGMLGSGNTEDHKMAQLILNTCDIQKSIYWIWLLGKKYAYNMVNLRTKAGRAFRDKSKLFYISGKSPLAFAEWLDYAGWITPEIYQRLESDIIKRAVLAFSHKFYDVTIKIKDKYTYLANNTSEISFKNQEND